MRPRAVATSNPTDRDLVIAARRGDVAALGLVLERHRARLHALALRLLGYAPDAEDAVQDTFLAAMRHIGSVRDPDAIGGWLAMVLRRECLQRRRRRSSHESLTDTMLEIDDPRPGPHERMERLELRDWIWAAMQRLAEPLRITAMLRYFGSYESYDDVAALLGVPVGTVRSRLSEVKIKLANELLASAGLTDDAAREHARDRERFWFGAFSEIYKSQSSREFVSNFAPDVTVAWSDGLVVHGHRDFAAEIDSDLRAGVRLVTDRVMSARGVVVVEARFVNPAHDPMHCPPGVSFVISGDDEGPSKLRLHLAPRPPRPADD